MPSTESARFVPNIEYIIGSWKTKVSRILCVYSFLIKYTTYKWIPRGYRLKSISVLLNFKMSKMMKKHQCIMQKAKMPGLHRI